MQLTPNGQVSITHIGGPTALIEVDEVRILTDPTFEPAGYQYTSGDQTLLKTTSPALTHAEVGSVDIVLLSHHQHGDNLDPAGRAYLSQAKHILTTPEGAQYLDGEARGVFTWETITVMGTNGLEVRVTATPASHGPLELKATGHVNGWLLEWKGQRRGALYISGDTILFDGLEEITRRYRIGLALLHFGAARVKRFGPVDITFTGVGGATFAKTLGNAPIIPIHYEGWSHLTEGRGEIEQAFAQTGIIEQLHFLPFGQSTVFTI